MEKSVSDYLADNSIRIQQENAEEEKFLITESDLAKYGRCYQAIGRVIGLKEAAHELSKQSGDHFRNGNDDLARITRDMSDYLLTITKREEVFFTKGADVAQREIWRKVFNITTDK